MSIKRLHVGPRMSQVVIHGDTVYTAGIVADDANTDVGGQTGQILDKIDRYLGEAGTELDGGVRGPHVAGALR